MRWLGKEPESCKECGYFRKKYENGGKRAYECAALNFEIGKVWESKRYYGCPMEGGKS